MKTSRPLCSVTIFAMLLCLGISSKVNAETNDEKLQKLAAQVEALTNEVNNLKKQLSRQSPAKDTGTPSPSGKSVPTKASPPPENPGLADFDKSSSLSLKDASAAFAVPNSPAAAALGVSPNNVQHVSTPKQLIPTLINGLDDRGNFQSGFAIDFAPAQLFNADKRPLSDFQGGENIFMDGEIGAYLQRLALRTQFSFASIKGTTTDDKSSKIALGIHSVLLEANDPILAGVSHNDRFFPDSLALNEWVKKPLDEGEGLFEQVVSHLSSSVGAAPAWISPDGSGDDYHYDGTTAWGSLSFRPAASEKADTSWAALLHSTNLSINAIYHNDEQIGSQYAIHKPAGSAAAAGATISQDSLFLVGGLEMGTHTTRAVLTGGLVELNQHALGSDTVFRYGITLERQIISPITGTDTWLTLSYEKDTGHKGGDDPTIILGGIKLGFGGNDFYAKDKIKTRSDAAQGP